MALAGKGASVYLTGAATSFSTEAASVVSGKTYAIDDTAKEIFDPATAVVVWDDGSPVDAADIEDINMLHGQVTFDSGYTVAGSVTFNSGKYLPRTEITTAKGGSVSVRRGRPDTSTLNTSARQRTGTTIDASGSLETFDPDLGTAVGGGKTLLELLDDDQTFVVEFNPGSGSVLRCRARMAREEMTTGTGEDDVAMGMLEWEMDAATSQEGYQMGIAWG